MAQFNLIVNMQARHHQMVGGFRTAAREAGAFARQARSARRELAMLEAGAAATSRRLATLGAQASRTGTHLRSVGRQGRREFNALRHSVRGVGHELNSLPTLAAAGAGLMLGREMFAEGSRYQREMNAFQAVTQANAGQMRRAAAVARELGDDLTLPAATAADAAEAFVELAKAGLRTDQSIDAARASLELASAANVNAADSARYLGDIMDQFGLGADQASRAADVLAATATNASGGITDIYYAMKYAGPVAASLSVPIEDAAAAVGMLHKAGILGHTAGTGLRRIMTNLAAPTARMTEGMEALGIEAWDAEGRFLGLRHVIEGLEEAMHSMSEQEFVGNANKAFGTYALAAATSLAHQGTDSFDDLSLAMHRTGTAADVTAARGQGLAGAVVQLRTQARQTGLALYDSLAPALEYVTRLATTGLATGTPYLTGTVDYARDLATLVGPDLRAAAREGLGELRAEARRLLGPLKDLGELGLAAWLGLLLDAADALASVLGNVADGVTPVVAGLSSLSGESGTAATAVNTVSMAMSLALDVVVGLSSVLIPLGEVVGGVIRGFGGLPGPVQLAIAAMLLSRRVLPPLTRLAQTVSGPVTTAWRGYGDQMRLQQQLAAQNSAQVGRLSAAISVLGTRMPIIGQMGAAFRSAQGPATGFAGAVNGAARAVGTGLLGAGRNLVGFFGGPWGVALSAAMFALTSLAQRQQKAAQAAAEHKQRVVTLADALRESSGAIDGNVRSLAAQTIQQYELYKGGGRLMDYLGDLGYSLRDVTDAYLEQNGSLNELAERMRDYASAADAPGADSFVRETNGRIKLYDDLADALDTLAGEADAARAAASDLDTAVGSEKPKTSAYGQLTAAVTELADATADADQRTRALRGALDLLAGGTISYQAAQARMNAAIFAVNDSLIEGVDKAEGYGTELLDNSGALNTATRNGQQLFNQLTSLADAAADATLAAYNLSQANGETLPESLAAARTEMETARDAAVSAAMSYGLTREEAKRVADTLGLLPSAVSILLQTEGLDSGLAGLLAVQAEFERLPDSKKIRVDSLSEEAQTDLRDLGFKVKTIPGTREIEITAPTAAARDELDLLIAALATMPVEHTVGLSAPEQAAVASLRMIQDELRATPGAKTIRMAAPTKTARKELEELGFTIRDLKGKKVEITVPTRGPTDAVSAIQQAINRVSGKSVTVTVNENLIRRTSDGRPYYVDGYQYTRAEGGIDLYRRSDLHAFVEGGLRHERHIAQIAPAGAWRVWAEPETGGEAYIPLAVSKRPRSRLIAAETVRRLGGEVNWYADGGLPGWRHETPELFTVSSIATASRDKKGNFSLGLFTKNLQKSVRVANRWRSDLRKVASRAGQDVADALAEMGEDGIALTRKMATGTTGYVRKMAAELTKLAAASKVSLSEYTGRLRAVVKDQQTFERNLVRLSAAGYGSLAAQLATQGDQDAAELAAQAVRNGKVAKQANAAAKAAAATLAASDLEDLLAIIGAVRTASTGIHAVADATGLDEDRIIDVANAARSHISAALGGKARRFLADLANASKGLAYADGGIWQPGIYRSATPLIKFAEPATGGEAYIPLAVAKRTRATAVLAEVAARFGHTLVPAAPQSVTPVRIVQARPEGAVRVVVVREQQPLIGSMPVTVNGGGSGLPAEKVSTEVMRRLRTAQRGGRI